MSAMMDSLRPVCFILLCFGTFVHAELQNEDGVTTDPVADHPIIKQLLSRVNYLESKDRMSSELIEKLTSELDKYKYELEALRKDHNGDTDDAEHIGGVRDMTTSLNLNGMNDLTNGSSEKLDGHRLLKKRTSHSRVRQQDAGTIAFTALSTGADLHIGANQNIIFESVLSNIGNGFNPHHGIFVAPASGTYVFFATVLANNNAETWTHFAVNGKNTANIYARGTDNRHDSGSQVIIVTLNKGDDVAVQSNYPDESIFGGFYTTFSGFLLSNTMTEIIG